MTEKLLTHAACKAHRGAGRKILCRDRKCQPNRAKQRHKSTAAKYIPVVMAAYSDVNYILDYQRDHQLKQCLKQLEKRGQHTVSPVSPHVT